MDALHHVTAAAPVAPLRTDEGGVVEARFFEVRATDGGRGVFATRAILPGTRLFGEDDWADEEERKRFSALTPDEIDRLAPMMRPLFLRFAYNSAADRVSGTFHPEAVRHPVNFLNHSCEPNIGYDGADHIVALVTIASGEELCMDYGTYTFSFDQEFTCRCGSLWCRGRITRNDWPNLVRAGLRLPAFMRTQTAKALWG